MLRSRIPSFCRLGLRAGIVFSLIALGGVAWSRPGGISGFSGKQGFICNQCHDNPGQTHTPGVKLDGPAVLDAGATAIYTFRIDTDAAATGMNAATTDGVLNADAGDDKTRMEDDEVTHIQPTRADAGFVTYSFSLTAPDYGGPVTLFAAGNAVNLDDTTDGDQPAGTKLDITINGPPKPVSTADSGTSLLPPEPPPPPPSTDAGTVSNSKARPTSDTSDSGCGIGRTHDTSLPGGAFMLCVAALAAVSRARRRES